MKDYVLTKRTKNILLSKYRKREIENNTMQTLKLMTSLPYDECVVCVKCSEKIEIGDRVKPVRCDNVHGRQTKLYHYSCYDKTLH